MRYAYDDYDIDPYYDDDDYEEPMDGMRLERLADAEGRYQICAMQYEALEEHKALYVILHWARQEIQRLREENDRLTTYADAIRQLEYAISLQRRSYVPTKRV